VCEDLKDHESSFKRCGCWKSGSEDRVVAGVLEQPLARKGPNEHALGASVDLLARHANPEGCAMRENLPLCQNGQAGKEKPN
jgi:hypothetical protein